MGQCVPVKNPRAKVALRRAKSPRITGIGAMLLVIATLSAYIPAMRGGFIWDDDFYVTNNPTIQRLGGLKEIWLETDANPQYYPVTFTSLWLQYRISGLHPFGYHLGNVLLHAGSSLLLWRILKGLGVPGAGLAAAIFALHPIEVESVAWVTERKNVLSGVFYLAAGGLYLRHSLAGLTPPVGGGKSLRGSGSWRIPALAFALFCCALLSKSITASLPVALALVIVWKRGHLPRKDLPWLSLMLVIGAAMGLFTASLEKHHVGAIGEDWSLTLLERCLLAGRIFWFYLAKLAWPQSLSFLYTRWEVDAGSVWQYLSLAAALAVPIAFWALRKRLGRGPLTALLYFGVTISPALGFLNVFPMRYSWVADHFQYLAGLGPIALFAAAAARTSNAGMEGGRSGTSVMARHAGAGLLLLALGVLTWRQGHSYRDLETLWRDTAERSPQAWLAHYNLANILTEQGKLDEAATHNRQALQAKPDYAFAWMNLGNALGRMGKIDEAIPYYKEAIRLKPSSPAAHYNFALALEAKGRFDEAVEEYKETVKSTPLYVEAEQSGTTALLLYREGAYGPPLWKTRTALARLLAVQGKTEDAIVHYRLAVGEKPDLPDALTGLGNALGLLGRVDEAMATYEKALAMDPTHALANYNLGLAYAEKGQTDRAIACYRQATKSSPGLAAAHNNLAILLYREGDYAEAWREIHACRRHGGRPHGDFLAALAARLREPPE